MEGCPTYTDVFNGTDPQLEHVDVVQTPPMRSNPSSKTKEEGKGKNFSVEDDRLLVSGWLNVGTDPKTGTNQTKGTFWARVHIYYQKHRMSLAERSESSLLHRWGAIQEAVSKFCGYITQIDGRNQSGLTIHDRIEEAEDMFQRLEKRSFTFRHSWLQLKDQPKWHEKLQQLAAQKAMSKKQKSKKKTSPGSSTPINVGDTDQESDGDVPQENNVPDAPSRPMGKKKAKELARRGGSEACIEALDILWAKKKELEAEKEVKKDERYAKTYALDKERLELEHKRLANEEIVLKNEQSKLANEAESLRLKTMLEEGKIMSMDLTTMNDGQREYYLNLQAQIRTKSMYY